MPTFGLYVTRHLSTNFGQLWAPANLDFSAAVHWKFINRICRFWCRNFKRVALTHDTISSCGRLPFSSLLKPNSVRLSSVCSPNSGGRAAHLARGARQFAGLPSGGMRRWGGKV